MDTTNNIATFKAGKELFNAKHGMLLAEYKEQVEKCKTALSEPFGVSSLWQHANKFMDLAIANEMVFFLENRIAFLLKDSPNMENLDRFIGQIFVQFCTTEVEASTAISREIEAKAKRTAYEAQLEFFVRHFDFPMKETIAGVIGYF